MAVVGTAGKLIASVLGFTTSRVVLPDSAVYKVNSVPSKDPGSMVIVPVVSVAGTTNE